MELNTRTALQNDFKRQIDGRPSKLVSFKSMGNIQTVCVKILQVKDSLFPAFAQESMVLFEAVNMKLWCCRDVLLSLVGMITEKRNKVWPKLNNISKVDSFAISMMYNVFFFVFRKSLKTRTKFPVLLS